MPAAERHLAVDAPAAPRGPLDLVAPLRATQGFPIRLHHRLQDLQTGRDAQAMERFPDTVEHAEHRQRHLNRDGFRYDISILQAEFARTEVFDRPAGRQDDRSSL